MCDQTKLAQLVDIRVFFIIKHRTFVYGIIFAPIIFIPLIYHSPSLAEISNMRSIGLLARAITSAGNAISGCSNRMQLYSFSRVLSFMYGQSLHAQALLGGAGINVLPGLAFCIWWMIPLSVATISVSAGCSLVYVNNPDVEPM